VGTILLKPERWSRVAARIRTAEAPIAWAWVLAPNNQQAWQLAALSVRSATPIKSQLLRYEHLVVVTEQLRPVDAARRFRAGTASEGIKFPVQQSTVTPSWVTTEPGTTYYLTEPDWPQYFLAHSLGSGGTLYIPMMDALIGDEQPYYPTIQGALADLVYGLAPGRLQVNFDPNIMVRLTDHRARIASVTFDEGLVSVTIEEGLPGGFNRCRLRAAWRKDSKDVEWVRFDKQLDRSGPVQLETSEVPAEMWMVVVDGSSHVLDRYGWSDAFGERPTILGPLTARVARWLTEGEHQQLEYKQELGGEKVNRSFAETVAAFANGSGGVIVVGVTDDAKVHGWDPPHASDLIANVISNYVKEPVGVQVEKTLADNKPVWVVTVPVGAPESRPYRCAGRVMIRVLGTTREATTSELRRLVSPPQASARDYFGRPGF